MEKQKKEIPINERRLLDKKRLAAYLSIGIDKATEYGINAGAMVRIGTRVLFDRLIIDKALTAEKEEARGNGHGLKGMK